MGRREVSPGAALTYRGRGRARESLTVTARMLAIRTAFGALAARTPVWNITFPSPGLITTVTEDNAVYDYYKSPLQQ